MRILFLLVVLSVTSALQSQVVIKENAIQSKYAFPLVTSKAKAVVVYDTDDYLVVRKTAELFVSDVESVTGQQLRLTDKLKGDKEIIIVGTVEKNRLIRQLAEEGQARYLFFGRDMGTISDSDGFPSIPRSQQSAGSSGERQAGSCVRTFFAFGNDGSVSLVLVG